MEIWIIVIFSICIAAIIKPLLFDNRKKKKKLPPGPIAIPFIGNLLWVRKSFGEIEPILRGYKVKYGPVIGLTIGSRPSIFIANHTLAHRTLIQNGAVYSDRPKPPPTSKIISSNQHNISSAGYGSTWRILRRNLTSEILHPTRVKSYTKARLWVLGVLIRRLNEDSGSGGAVKVVDHLQYAMFCLLVLMCFGDKLDHDKITEIETVQRRLILSFDSVNILNIFPRLGKIVFRKKWKEFMEILESQERILVPLIDSRIQYKQEKNHNSEDDVIAYVDTLVDLELTENGEKRKPNKEEIVSLCSEFLNGGTDTTSTALQWILANLVKNPEIQSKLYEEVSGVMGGPPPQLLSVTGSISVVVKEEDVQKMPYLKSVVLEGLRRHPPGHFVLPHSVSEEVELEGYRVPKNTTVNFMVADLGWDPEVWEDPMEFKPERFFKEGSAEFDITGSKEIKMMPFGAGRRICPGLGLAMLHLEYFVANLIWYMEWKNGGDQEIDLSEKQEFTIVMKNPLMAKLSPRSSSSSSTV